MGLGRFLRLGLSFEGASMIDARHGWNAAQRASEREQKKPRKMHDGVGPSGATPMMISDSTRTVKCCGFHVHAPTCPTQRQIVPKPPLGQLRHYPRPGTGKEQLEAARTFGIEEAERLVNAGETVRVVTSVHDCDVGSVIERRPTETVVKPPSCFDWLPSSFPRHYETATFEVVES